MPEREMVVEDAVRLVRGDALWSCWWSERVAEPKLAALDELLDRGGQPEALLEEMCQTRVLLVKGLEDEQQKRRAMREYLEWLLTLEPGTTVTVPLTEGA